MAKVDGRRNRKKVKKPLKPAQRKKLAKSMIGNQNSVGNEGGRPVVYTSKIAKDVRDMLIAMFPVKQIAQIVGVNVDTLYEWRKTIPEFSEMWEYGVNGIDKKIVRALSKRAAGFKKRVEKPIKMKDDKTGGDTIVNHKYIEYHPPDIRAVELWLKNRSNLKTQWSNLPDEAAPPPPPTVNVNQIDLSKLDDATISKILRAIKPPDAKG